MSKTLIQKDNLEQFICCNTLLMDNGKILTAGARDELIRRGVQIVYGEEGQCCNCHKAPQNDVQPSCCNTAPHAATPSQFDEEMLIGVAAIIRQHYGITDPEVLRKVTLETAAAISSSNS